MTNSVGIQTARRAFVLKKEINFLTKQIEALALILQGQSYNRGFDAGFDYAASGTATSETDPETGETLRILTPAEGDAA